MRGTGCLEDIFTDTNSINNNRMFNPYTADTQVIIHCRDKQEDKAPDQQIKGVGPKAILGDERLAKRRKNKNKELR